MDSSQHDDDAASTAMLERRLQRLLGNLDQLRHQQRSTHKQLEDLNAFLGRADRVNQHLNEMSRSLVDAIIGPLEHALTKALRDILDDASLSFHSTVRETHRSLSVEFHVKRDGKEEDIMKGMGGSVANVLSTGLRLFTLRTLDPARHRPFLVLDEQDCWLRADLIPRFTGMIHQATQQLGIQVLMISHHDVELFRDHADRIFHITPQADGVAKVRMIYDREASHRDVEA